MSKATDFLNKSSTTSKLTAFMSKAGNGAWPKLDRTKIGQGLIYRITNPDSIDQKQTSFCGPSCFVRAVIVDMPEQYFDAVIDLYETGSTRLRGVLLEPRSEIRRSAPTGNTEPIDFMMLASLRDTFNAFLSPVGIWPDLASMTLPKDMRMWFWMAGYSDVSSDTSLSSFTRPPGIIQFATLHDMNDYFNDGYKVVMLIDSDILETATQDSNSHAPDHWVGLTSAVSTRKRPATFDDAVANEAVSLEVFTWGRNVAIPRDPRRPLRYGEFLDHYYGYVAAKP